MKNTSTESGRTMVEMLGVLAIIGVLMVGAITMTNLGMQSMRVSSAYTQVENVAQGVSDLYSWKRNYPTDSAQMKTAICKNKIFDTECVENSNAAIRTAWGLLTVSPATGDKAGKEFVITLTNVPYIGCNQLLNMDWTNVTLETKTCDEPTTPMTFTAY